MQKLITRADDFGVTPGTNDAILDCIKAGWIQNVGVMAPGPFLNHRLDAFLELQDEICLGVHGTLTSEWDLLRWGSIGKAAEGSSLLRPEDGTFYPDTQSLSTYGKTEEIIQELRAQIHHLRDLGLRPSYWDSHMNFTWIEGLSEQIAALCREEGLFYTHTDAHGRFLLPLSQENSPSKQDWETATANYLETQSGKIPVWICHPAYRESPGHFPEKVIQDRHFEATNLTRHAKHITELAAQNGWQAAKYV
ncbi:ChbG/HpnK family deacetylase [Kiritimatiellaeota bacterium B1221]|nr:ChbG/HpnK family deacetylase [Kiritimatiellaeota bacterium B1221]